jgi:hypothetical protein
MKKQIYFIVFFISFFSCEQKKTEFVYIKKRSHASYYEGHRYLDEVVFVINPPRSAPELVKLIEAYNSNTIKQDSIKNSFYSFKRSFFRESNKTPRDFEDFNTFIPDRLDDHLFDHLATYSMKRCSGDNVDSTRVEWTLEESMHHPYPFKTIHYEIGCSQ